MSERTIRRIARVLGYFYWTGTAGLVIWDPAQWWGLVLSGAIAEFAGWLMKQPPVLKPAALTLEQRMDRLEASLPPPVSLFDGAMVSLHTAMPVLGREEETEVRYVGYAPQPLVNGTISFPRKDGGPDVIATHLLISGSEGEPRVAQVDRPVLITQDVVVRIPIGSLKNADGSYINGEPPPEPTCIAKFDNVHPFDDWPFKGEGGA